MLHHLGLLLMLFCSESLCASAVVPFDIADPGGLVKEVVDTQGLPSLVNAQISAEHLAHLLAAQNEGLSYSSGHCPCGWTQFATQCYKYFDNQTTWSAAEATCVAEGGHLASINSKDENDFIHQLSNCTQQDLWIGSHDDDADRHWRWTDQSEWEFAAWARVEHTGNWWEQQCGHMFALDGTLGGRRYAGGEWHIVMCSLRYNFVCQHPIALSAAPTVCPTETCGIATPTIMPISSTTKPPTTTPSTTTSSTTKPPTPTPSTTTLPAGCPEERPSSLDGYGWGACLPSEEGLTCSYGNQTCCGETSPEIVLNCQAKQWSGYFVDTPCFFGYPCPENSTTAPTTTTPQTPSEMQPEECEWLQWINNDGPTWTCDCESYRDTNLTCEVEKYEVSLASGGPVYTDVSSVPHNNLVFLPTVPGIYCLNKDQENCQLAANGHKVGPSPPCCLDYKIRFCCKTPSIPTHTQKPATTTIPTHTQTVTTTADDAEPSTTTLPTPTEGCPEERPSSLDGYGWGACLPSEEGLTCPYGNQTCCGETTPEMVLECRAEQWSGYFVDTRCVLGVPCPTESTTSPTTTAPQTPTLTPTPTVKPTDMQPECHFTYSRLCALRVDYECSGNTSTVLTFDQQLFTSADLQNTNFEDGMFRAPTTGTFAVNFWTKGFTGVNGGHLDLYHNKKRIAWDESNMQYDQYNKVVSLIAGDTLHIRVDMKDCQPSGHLLNSVFCVEPTTMPSTIATTPTKTVEDAVLIVGGVGIGGIKKSSEVFFPRTGTGCFVQDYDFPDGVYTGTLNTILGKTILCGGVNNLKECFEFTPESPTVWSKYADLNNNRHLHITWESSQGLVVMGGWDSPKTAEMVNGDILSFPQSSIRRGCGITDSETDSVIVTGGFETPTNVFRYNLTGQVEELPAMNQGRTFHGCGSYRDETTNKLVLIVAGGVIHGSKLIDTSEKHVIGENNWRMIKTLPRVMSGLTDGTISMNNKIYIFGGYNLPADIYNDILEYDDENEGWKKVGEMQIPRRNQGTAPIKADQMALCGSG